MIGANKKLLMASGAPVDRTYDITNVDFAALSLVNYDYPAITKGAITNAALVPLDGGSTIFVSSGLGIIDISVPTPYRYNAGSFLLNRRSTGGNCANSYFRADGLRVYVAGDTTNAVDQYTLSTPWLASTSGSATSQSMVGLGTTPLTHLYFKGDGTRLYLLYQGSRTVVELTLSTAWDITTATATGVVLDMTTDIPTGRTLRNIQFKIDGSSVFVTSYVSNVLYVTEYALSTAWDLASASFVQTTSRSAVGQETLSFNPAGTEAYTVTYFGSTVYKYALSTAWDWSTATQVGATGSVTGRSLNYNALFIPDDGSRFIITESLFADVFNIATPVSGTAFDHTTLSLVLNPVYIIQGTAGSNVGWFRFSNSGSKLFVMDTARVLYEHTLTTPYDITSASYTGNSITLPATTLTSGTSFDVSGDGTRIVCSAAGTTINQYTLATAWDLSTASGPTAISLSDIPTSPAATPRPVFSSDGTKVFIFNRGDMYSYPLGANWDVTTVGTPVPSVNPMRLGHSITLFDGGTKLCTGNTTNLLTFNVPTANSPATAPYNDHLIQSPEAAGLVFDFGRQLIFNSAGTRLYTYRSGRIVQWALSTAWDLRTASWVYETPNTFPASNGLFFSMSRDERYFLAAASNTLAQYEASTPGDLTTLSLVGTRTINSLRGVTYSNDGAYLYAVRDNINFFAYPLATPFDITTAGAETSTGSSGNLTDGGTLSPTGASKDTFTMISFADARITTRYATGSGLYLNAKPMRDMMVSASATLGYKQNGVLSGIAWANPEGTKIAFTISGTFAADFVATLATFDIPT